MQKYHPDFAFFRGYVFFDCDDAGRLPWTTTKTGVDSDSWLFRAVRAEMITVAKQVLSFLREMAREREDVKHGDRSESNLFAALSAAAPAPVLTLPEQRVFLGPVFVPLDGPKQQKIQYSRPAEEVEAVKAHLGAASFTEVGIRTFEYYKEYEMDS